MRTILLNSLCLYFLLNAFCLAMEGPVHHPDYYARITGYILADQHLAVHHHKNAVQAMGYIEDSRVSPSIKASLINQIFLKSELEKFQMPAASVGITLLEQGVLDNRDKAMLALHFFTKRSLKKYYQHEVAIKAWKEFSSDLSTYSSISLAKEVIASTILENDKFRKHYEHAILVWKNLNLHSRGFMICNILINDDLVAYHSEAEKTLRRFFAVDSDVPFYTKKRLAEMIENTRGKRLKNARTIAASYLASLPKIKI
ncbi:MAG: hypothetical protein ACK4V2_05355 [Pseudomonadota bacterium]|jgi:hypothetical protein|nr:hypothetical protein [Alphaproteobacteria bacterium]